MNEREFERNGEKNKFRKVKKVAKIVGFGAAMLTVGYLFGMNTKFNQELVTNVLNAPDWENESENGEG